MQENIHYRNEAEPTEVSTNNRYYVDMEARFEAFRNHEIDMRSLHTMVYDVNNVALAVRQLVEQKQWKGCAGAGWHQLFHVRTLLHR